MVCSESVPFSLLVTAFLVRSIAAMKFVCKFCVDVSFFFFLILCHIPQSLFSRSYDNCIKPFEDSPNCFLIELYRFLLSLAAGEGWVVTHSCQHCQPSNLAVLVRKKCVSFGL